LVRKRELYLDQVSHSLILILPKFEDVSLVEEFVDQVVAVTFAPPQEIPAHTGRVDELQNLLYNPFPSFPLQLLIKLIREVYIPLSKDPLFERVRRGC